MGSAGFSHCVHAGSRQPAKRVESVVSVEYAFTTAFSGAMGPLRPDYLFNAAFQLTTTVSGVEFNCPIA